VPTIATIRAIISGVADLPGCIHPSYRYRVTLSRPDALPDSNSTAAKG
jgi:hypothetical protein